ncbi:hypothetical protein LJH26_004276 [Salmonella enterica]|nr:hypothetical protein [Salmonella enterica]
MLTNPSKTLVPFMTRLTELAGEDTANRLANEFGGKLVYLPFQIWQPPETVDAICKAFTGDNHAELAKRFRTNTNVIFWAIQQHQKQRIKQSLLVRPEYGESGMQVHQVIPVTQSALPDLLEAVLLAAKMATTSEIPVQFHIALVSHRAVLSADTPVQTPQYGTAESQSDSSGHPDSQPDH